MSRTKSEDYKSVLVAFLISVALLLASAGLPAQLGMLLLPLTVLLLPLLLGYAVAAGGFAAGSMALVLCFAAGSALDYKACLLLAALIVPFALTVGYVIRKQVRFRYSVTAASGAALVGAAMAVGVLWLLTGEKPVDYVINGFSSTLAFMDDTSINAYYQMVRYSDLLTGAVTQAALDAASRADAIAFIVEQFREMMNVTLVSLIGTYALLMGLIGYLFPRSVLKKRKAQVIPIPPFSEYALPNRFWLAFILSYLFAVIGRSFGWPGFDILEVTIYVLYALVLTVQGLSFLDYMYKRRNMGAAARVALHALALVISSLASLVGSLLMWVGLFENMAKLRKRLESKGGAVM